MKVKRYDLDPEAWSSAQMTEEDDGEYVDFADYDALLALARSLRGALIFDYGREPLTDGTISQICQCAKCKALRDSAWLEE